MAVSSDQRLGPVSVKYRLRDLYAVNLYSWRAYIPPLLIVGAFLAAIFVGFPIIDGMRLSEAIQGADWSVLGILLGALIAFWMILGPLIGYFRSWRLGHLRPIDFALSDAGVEVMSFQGQATIFWAALKRVTTTRTHLFLFVTQGLAYILPRRAFGNNGEFAQWSEFAERSFNRDQQPLAKVSKSVTVE
jgi:hypothetical protein